MKYWLMKSEPDVFSIDDLKKKKKTLLGRCKKFPGEKFYEE